LEVTILPVGKIDGKVLSALKEGLSKVLQGYSIVTSSGFLEIPKEAYNPLRRQYLSTHILREILSYAEKSQNIFGSHVKVLGVTEADLYVAGLNFVFGEAQCPGKAAVISLCRLKPEFYGEPPNERLFYGRAVKEAVHELGHTFGLGHCPTPSCVMHFSLHIGMTDLKGPAFCSSCLQTIKAIT